MSSVSTRAIRVCALAASVVGAVYFVAIGSGRTYVVDEWVWLAARSTPSIEAFLSPHNGHPVAVPASIYMAVFNLVGINHPEIFRVISVVLHLAIGAMVAALIQRRHGPAVAAIAGAWVVLSGAGAAEFLSGFQMSFLLSIAGLLIFALMMEQSDRAPSTLARGGAATALLVSAFASGVGVSALAAALLIALLSPHRRQIWWVPLPAFCLTGWWIVAQGPVSGSRVLPRMTFDWITLSPGHLLSAVVNVPVGWGHLAAALIVLSFLTASVRGRVTRTAHPWAVFLVVFWVSLSISGGNIFRDYGTSRFLYVGMVGMVLFLSELAPRMGDPGSRRATLSTWSLALVAIVSIVVQFPQIERIDSSIRKYWMAGPDLRGAMSIAELLGDQIDPNAHLSTFLGKPTFAVGTYTAVMRRFDTSPAYPPRDLPRAPEDVRVGADLFLNTSNVVRATVEPTTECPGTSSPRVEVQLAGGEEVTVRVPVETRFRVRRFADNLPDGSAWRPIAPGLTTLAVPSDALPTPWVLTFESPVGVAPCGTAPG